MPIHVEVKINHESIGTIHIGRTDQLLTPDQTSGYLVTTNAEMADALTVGDIAYGNIDYMVDWKGGIPFSHKYSDGALVCVRKAIEALEEAGDVF